MELSFCVYFFWADSFYDLPKDKNNYLVYFGEQKRNRLKLWVTPSGLKIVSKIDGSDSPQDYAHSLAKAISRLSFVVTRPLAVSRH